MSTFVRIIYANLAIIENENKNRIYTIFTRFYRHPFRFHSPISIFEIRIRDNPESSLHPLEKVALLLLLYLIMLSVRW